MTRPQTGNRPRTSSAGARPIYSPAPPPPVEPSRLARARGRSGLKVQPTVTGPVDLVLYGDSWVGMQLHRGADVENLEVSLGFGEGLEGLESAIANVSFGNASAGFTSSGSPDEPELVGTGQAHGAKGYGSTTGKGVLADALEAAGWNPEQVNVWEFGLGNATLGYYDETNFAPTSSSLAMNQGRPTRVDPVGGTYGCPTGTIPGGHQKQNRVSGWLAKQDRLIGTGDEYEDWSICDVVAHPPTGRVVVARTGWGNDVFGITQKRPYLDPYTGEWDPTGWLALRYAELAQAAREVDEAFYLLNPDAELWWLSYFNFQLDDPEVRNFHGPFPGVDGWRTRADWNDYQLDGPNLADPLGAGGGYDDPNTVDRVTWPGGSGLLSLPFNWSPSSPGFKRVYGGWTPYRGQWDENFAYMRDWYARHMANSLARQAQGTAANPGFFRPRDTSLTRSDGSFYESGYWVNEVGPGNSYGHQHYVYQYQWWTGSYAVSSYYVIDGWGPTPNYTWRHEAYLYNSVNYTGRRWLGIFDRTVQASADGGTLNNLVFLTGGAFLGGHTYATLLSKDVTSANIARVMRDPWRELALAEQAHHRSLGRRYIAVDVWDDTSRPEVGTSQDNPAGVPVGPESDWIEGVHLTGAGARDWCRAIVDFVLPRTELFREDN